MRIALLVACLLATTSPLWGKIAFYSHRDGNTEIYTMDSDGSDQTRLTFNEASDSSPVWSPNGQQIAFHSKRDGNWEIYVMDADGSNQRNLTRHPALDGYPYWSPDGSQIAFCSKQNANENHRLNIFVMDADGSNAKQVTRLEFATNPQWSPDGKQILFESDIDQGRQIYAIRPDGRGLWRVSQPKPDTGMLLGGWSPDGKKVVYVETVGFDSNKSVAVIATLHPAGKQLVVQREPLQLPPWDMTSETWSADGESILFAGRNRAVTFRKDGNNWEIYRFRLRDSQLTQLTNHPQDDLGPHEWDPRLAVPPQQGRLLLHWGKIKSSLSRPVEAASP